MFQLSFILSLNSYYVFTVLSTKFYCIVRYIHVPVGMVYSEDLMSLIRLGSKLTFFWCSIPSHFPIWIVKHLWETKKKKQFGLVDQNAHKFTNHNFRDLIDSFISTNAFKQAIYRGFPEQINWWVKVKFPWLVSSDRETQPQKLSSWPM